MIIVATIGGVVAVALLLGATMSWRDQRRGSNPRKAGTMWRSTVREEHRDARATVGGQRLRPDLRWTEWSRRNHRS